jgi:magnesium-transporting ATPase (P-type)
MKLSPAQEQLLEQLGTNVELGLSADEVSSRREQDGTFNVVEPPINCPSWICCLLPCIKHVPSMKAFRQVQPEDAEVLRSGKWIRYDASSLVKGDIIRMEAGDIVPADCVVLSVYSEGDFLVDVKCVAGEDKPRVASATPTSTGKAGTVQPIQLFMGGQVVQGSGMAVVTAIGKNTLLASLIREGRFPPKDNAMAPSDIRHATVGMGMGGVDEEVGISLIKRETV